MFSSNTPGDYNFPELVTKNYYAWGRNDQYQHGDGTNLPKTSPSMEGQWARVACGPGQHCLALDSQGSMFGWGLNSHGQVMEGAGEVAVQPTPYSDYWLAVSCGGSHSAAINSDRTLWGWGINDAGQAGSDYGHPVPIGTYPYVGYPERIAQGSWIHVACGRRHSFAIRSDRTLWGWGDSSDGQIKNASFFTSPALVNMSLGPVLFEGIRDVSCGWFHTAAVKMDGSIWTWGRNIDGQLGNGITSNNSRNSPGQVGEDYDWDSVSCGSNHCAALKRDGTLWTWGRGTEGQLGLGSTVQGATVPTQVGSDRWKKVSCGSYFTAGIKIDGTLWTWGHNIWDQLGLGSSYSLTDEVPSPTIVSSPNVTWNDISCSEVFMVGLGDSSASFSGDVVSAGIVGRFGRFLSFFGLK